MKLLRIIGWTIGISLVFATAHAKADCGSWRVEVQNETTSETKLYTIQEGQEFNLPLPMLHKTKCMMLVDRDNKIGSGNAASLLCSATNENRSQTITTAAACLDSDTQGDHGSLLISDINSKTKMGALYHITFHPENQSN